MKITILLLIIPLSAMGQPEFYHLEVNGNNAKVSIFLNGFPVHEGDNEYDAVASVPVQLILVGENNKLEISAETAVRGKPGHIEVSIVPYSKGDFSDTGLAKEGILNFEMKLNTERKYETYNFNNQGHDYSYIFRESTPIDEGEALIYGEYLYGLLKNGDTENFVNEMPHRIKDFGDNYGYSQDQMVEGMTQQLKDMFFTDEYPDFNDTILSAQSYSDGRVWELLINEDKFLKKNEDDSSVQIPIYVARINGKISIVR